MENKQNFYLKNNEVIEFLELKNKNEYITQALKNAMLNYRSFVEFTRKKLNPKSSETKQLNFDDLIYKNSLKNNTIISSGQIRIFAADSTKIERDKNGVLTLDNVEIEMKKPIRKIEYKQIENDFNDNDVCVEVSMEGENAK